MDRTGAQRSCALAFAVVVVGACGRVGFDASTADASSPGAFGPGMELEEVSTTGHDHAPTLTADRLEIYFESRPGGDEDIWKATRLSAQDPFGPPSVVAELSSPTIDTGPKLAADGLTIWFASERPGGVGLTDIWTSTRQTRGDPWSAPVNAIGLNSPQHDYSASPDLSLFSPDGRQIV